MTYLFVYHTKEWKRVGKAIKRYFKNVLNREVELKDIKEIPEDCLKAFYRYAKYRWDKNYDAAKKDLVEKYKDRLSEDELKKIFPDFTTLIVPLFKIFENEAIEPLGIETIKLLRRYNNNFITFFLVLSKDEIPKYFDPEEEMLGDYVVKIIKNPVFGSVDKAVFLGELRYKYDEKQKKYEYLNVISLLNGTEELKKVVNTDEMLQISEACIKEYYDTFAYFYDPFENLKQIGSSTGEFDKIDLAKKYTLSEINKAYNKLHGITTRHSGHYVELELFRAPLPFPLQELVEFKEEIEEALGEKRKIKLLLIDNKWDKFYEDNKEGSLTGLIKEFDLQDLFEVEMIANPEFYEKNQKQRIYWDGEKFQGDIDKAKKSIAFYFRRFREDMKEILREDEGTSKHANNYANLVYDRIKSSHFVLLDFFLDKDDVYYGYEFIKDINMLKRKKKDYTLTWYFITSAVYDATSKYAQSGLLSEFYESSVVNSGDDPANEKRKIIFVYKLLGFINARLKNFRRHKDAIFERLMNTINVEHEAQCDFYSPEREKDQCDECLQDLQKNIKKFLAELDNVGPLFFDKSELDVYRTIAELLDNIINQFFWLPEADWQIVQHQIDFVDEKLRQIGEKRRFSCNHIRREIRNRSEIY